MIRNLSQELDHLCQLQPFATSFVFENLRNGYEARIERNADLIVESFSTRKVQIMMLVLHHVETKRFSLFDEIQVKREDQFQSSLYSGILHAFQPGIKLTVYDLLVCMIALSDLTATYLLGNLVGGIRAFNEHANRIGMNRTKHTYIVPPLKNCQTALGVTSAGDMAQLLRLILEGSRDAQVATYLGVSSSLCQLALQIMTYQKLNTRIPFFLDNVIVAHKTGSTLNRKHCLVAHVYADIGIVFDEKRNPLYLLAVFTNHVPQKINNLPGKAMAELHIAQLSLVCYRHVMSDSFMQGISFQWNGNT